MSQQPDVTPIHSDGVETTTMGLSPADAFIRGLIDRRDLAKQLQQKPSVTEVAPSPPKEMPVLREAEQPAPPKEMPVLREAEHPRFQLSEQMRQLIQQMPADFQARLKDVSSEKDMGVRITEYMEEQIRQALNPERLTHSIDSLVNDRIRNAQRYEQRVQDLYEQVTPESVDVCREGIRLGKLMERSKNIFDTEAAQQVYEYFDAKIAENVTPIDQESSQYARNELLRWHTNVMALQNAALVIIYQLSDERLEKRFKFLGLDPEKDTLVEIHQDLYGPLLRKMASLTVDITIPMRHVHALLDRAATSSPNYVPLLNKAAVEFVVGDTFGKGADVDTKQAEMRESYKKRYIQEASETMTSPLGITDAYVLPAEIGTVKDLNKVEIRLLAASLGASIAVRTVIEQYIGTSHMNNPDIPEGFESELGKRENEPVDGTYPVKKMNEAMYKAQKETDAERRVRAALPTAETTPINSNMRFGQHIDEKIKKLPPRLHTFVDRLKHLSLKRDGKPVNAINQIALEMMGKIIDEEGDDTSSGSVMYDTICEEIDVLGAHKAYAKIMGATNTELQQHIGMAFERETMTGKGKYVSYAGDDEQSTLLNEAESQVRDILDVTILTLTNTDENVITSRLNDEELAQVNALVMTRLTAEKLARQHYVKTAIISNFFDSDMMDPNNTEEREYFEDVFEDVQYERPLKRSKPNTDDDDDDSDIYTDFMQPSEVEEPSVYEDIEEYDDEDDDTMMLSDTPIHSAAYKKKDAETKKKMVKEVSKTTPAKGSITKKSVTTKKTAPKAVKTVREKNVEKTKKELAAEQKEERERIEMATPESVQRGRRTTKALKERQGEAALAVKAVKKPATVSDYGTRQKTKKRKAVAVEKVQEPVVQGVPESEPEPPMNAREQEQIDRERRDALKRKLYIQAGIVFGTSLVGLGVSVYLLKTYIDAPDKSKDDIPSIVARGVNNIPTQMLQQQEIIFGIVREKRQQLIHNVKSLKDAYDKNHERIIDRLKNATGDSKFFFEGLLKNQEAFIGIVSDLNAIVGDMEKDTLALMFRYHHAHRFINNISAALTTCGEDSGQAAKQSLQTTQVSPQSRSILATTPMVSNLASIAPTTYADMAPAAVQLMTNLNEATNAFEVALRSGDKTNETMVKLEMNRHLVDMNTAALNTITKSACDQFKKTQDPESKLSDIVPVKSYLEGKQEQAMESIIDKLDMVRKLRNTISQRLFNNTTKDMESLQADERFIFETLQHHVHEVLVKGAQEVMQIVAHKHKMEEFIKTINGSINLATNDVAFNMTQIGSVLTNILDDPKNIDFQLVSETKAGSEDVKKLVLDYEHINTCQYLMFENFLATEIHSLKVKATREWFAIAKPYHERSPEVNQATDLKMEESIKEGNTASAVFAANNTSGNATTAEVRMTADGASYPSWMTSVANVPNYLQTKAMDFVYTRIGTTLRRISLYRSVAAEGGPIDLDKSTSDEIGQNLIKRGFMTGTSAQVNALTLGDFKFVSDMRLIELINAERSSAKDPLPKLTFDEEQQEIYKFEAAQSALYYRQSVEVDGILDTFDAQISEGKLNVTEQTRERLQKTRKAAKERTMLLRNDFDTHMQLGQWVAIMLEGSVNALRLILDARMYVGMIRNMAYLSEQILIAADIIIRLRFGRELKHTFRNIEFEKMVIDYYESERVFSNAEAIQARRRDHPKTPGIPLDATASSGMIDWIGALGKFFGGLSTFLIYLSRGIYKTIDGAGEYLTAIPTAYGIASEIESLEAEIKDTTVLNNITKELERRERMEQARKELEKLNARIKNKPPVRLGFSALRLIARNFNWLSAQLGSAMTSIDGFLERNIAEASGSRKPNPNNGIGWNVVDSIFQYDALLIGPLIAVTLFAGAVPGIITAIGATSVGLASLLSQISNQIPHESLEVIKQLGSTMGDKIAEVTTYLSTLDWKLQIVAIMSTVPILTWKFFDTIWSIPSVLLSIGKFIAFNTLGSKQALVARLIRAVASGTSIVASALAFFARKMPSLFIYMIAPTLVGLMAYSCGAMWLLYGLLTAMAANAVPIFTAAIATPVLGFMCDVTYRTLIRVFDSTRAKEIEAKHGTKEWTGKWFYTVRISSNEMAEMRPAEAAIYSTLRLFSGVGAGITSSAINATYTGRVAAMGAEWLKPPKRIDPAKVIDDAQMILNQSPVSNSTSINMTSARDYFRDTGMEHVEAYLSIVETSQTIQDINATITTGREQLLAIAKLMQEFGGLMIGKALPDDKEKETKKAAEAGTV